MHKSFALLLCFLFSAASGLGAERAVISVVFSSDIRPYKEAWEGFKAFFEGKGAAPEFLQYDLSGKDAEKFQEEMAGRRPSLIYVLGTSALKWAEEKIKDIPVVYGMVLYPPAEPRPNVTGVFLDIPAGLKLEKLKKVAPRLEKIGVIYSPESANEYERIARACRLNGLKVVSRNVPSGTALPDALKEISWDADCLLMVADSKIYFPKSVENLLFESLRMKFPVVGLSSFYTKAGALVSFDCDFADLGRQSAEMAWAVLSGEKPEAIRPSPPRKVEFSLNLLVSRRLGIKIDPEVVKEAAAVFK